MKTRKKIILFCLIDIILYIFFRIFINQGINSITNLYFEKFYFLPIWLLISYVLGRYSSNSFPFILAILKMLFKTSIVLLLVYSSYILSNKTQIDIPANIYFYYSFISAFSQIIAFLSIKIKSSKPEKWYFLGNQERYKKLISEVQSGRNIPIINHCEIKDFQTISTKGIEGFIFDDSISIYRNSDFGKSFFDFNNIGLKFISIEEFCGFNLHRYPVKLISSEIYSNINHSRKISTIDLRIKRLSDIIFSILLLIITTPLIILSSIFIYLEDKGPVFYSQMRTGLHGKIFRIVKLRSMKIRAEVHGAEWASNSDPRISSVGKIIRKIRFDELPQLWLVIKGEMSLIGPRPERPEFDEKLEKVIPFYNQRYRVRPGLSGWAQVNYPYGASQKDSENKLSYDLYYIRHFSILLDLLILIKTIKIVLTGQGAQPNK